MSVTITFLVIVFSSMKQKKVRVKYHQLKKRRCCFRSSWPICHNCPMSCLTNFVRSYTGVSSTSYPVCRIRCRYVAVSLKDASRRYISMAAAGEESCRMMKSRDLFCIHSSVSKHLLFLRCLLCSGSDFPPFYSPYMYAMQKQNKISATLFAPLFPDCQQNE